MKEKTLTIPFVPFPLKQALKFSRSFLGFGNFIAKTMPALKLNLFQAGVELDSREYASLAIFSGIFYFAILFILTLVSGVIARAPSIPLSLGVGFVFGLFVYFYLLTWPRLLALRRMKNLEKDLLNALHHILIEIKSGVPLFNALTGVSEGYGEVSEEFRKVVKEINAGTSETDALDTAVKRNPSLHFRRAVWQIINALRAGSDIGRALEAIVVNLTSEQMIAIKRYGQELNPYTMMYMLIAVIAPSLGITFLIILSSFSGLTVPKLIFPVIAVGLILFQFFYMGLIKTKRPAMEI